MSGDSAAEFVALELLKKLFLLRHSQIFFEMELLKELLDCVRSETLGTSAAVESSNCCNIFLAEKHHAEDISHHLIHFGRSHWRLRAAPMVTQTRLASDHLFKFTYYTCFLI